MKIKCNKCGKEFDVPKSDCVICFSDVLGQISDIEDSEIRFTQLSEFINELCAFDYERGYHNAKCENQLSESNIIGLEFVEVDE